MHPKKRLMLLIVLFGGGAVITSYVFGALIYPDSSEILWGGVPQNLRPFITVNMFLGATGFFAFTYFILFHQDPKNTRIYNRFGFGVFIVFYLAILIPSALWMPLVYLTLEKAASVFLLAVKIDLIVVGLASVALFFSLLSVEPRQPTWAYWMAAIGSVFFCIQTVLLDAIIWGVFFKL
jgi:hypothetical protein